MVWLTFLFLLLPTTQDPQIPPIGVIDFYGLRGVTEQQAREALQIKEGDSLSDEPKDARRRLEAIPGVSAARLNFVCCEAGQATLYVGIREKSAPSVSFHSAPRRKVRLSPEVTLAGEDFQKAFTEAILKGNSGEDDSQGHTLTNDPTTRAIQERFITFAACDLKTLRDVLRHSTDAEQRALAVQVIAYAKDKQSVVNDLIWAMGDPAEGVRNNAMRALAVMAETTAQKTKQPINIPAQPFIKMLNSIEWTDRNKSSLALLRLTEKRDPNLLSELGKKAGPSLIEMARWKISGHAYAPFFLLGRVAGFSDNEINESWEHDGRAAFIDAVIKRTKAN
jgi:hypothetical protein